MPQAIPLGELVTVPLPVFETVSVFWKAVPAAWTRVATSSETLLPTVCIAKVLSPGNAYSICAELPDGP